MTHFCFQICFPINFLRDVIIPETIAKLESTKTQQLTMSEFCGFLGHIACFEGVSYCWDWWSSSPINKFKGAPFYLNECISLWRFKDIMQAVHLTNLPHPPFSDKLLHTRQMIDLFNEHYIENYIPGWISYISESMCVWLDK